MAFYWYSTDGMDQKRLSSRHFDLLDRAYEGRTRVEIFDDTAFGPNVCAIADPFLGTMTAGDIHYGLYRHPTLARVSESSIDSLVLFDSTTIVLEEPATCVSSGSSALQNNHNQRNRFIYYHTGGDDDSAMGLVDHRRSHIQQFLSAPSNMTTAPTPMLARRGPSLAQGTTADEDCVCCVIS